jgi:hypothetical protein
MAAAIGRTLADFYFPALRKSGLAPRDAGKEFGWWRILQEGRARRDESPSSAGQIQTRVDDSTPSGRNALPQMRSEERARSGRPRREHAWYNLAISSFSSCRFRRFRRPHESRPIDFAAGATTRFRAIEGN